MKYKSDFNIFFKLTIFNLIKSFTMKRLLLSLVMTFLVAYGISAQESNFRQRGNVETSTKTLKKTGATQKHGVEGRVVRLHNKANRGSVFSETFSGGALPAGWTSLDNSGSSVMWSFNNPGGRSINTSTGAGGFAILDSDVGNNGGIDEDADLITPAIDCSTLAAVKLTFEHYYKQYSNSTATVSVSGDNGATWTSLESWTTTNTSNAAVASYDISAVAAGKSQVKIKWNYKGNWAYYWAIDDINVFEPNSHDLAVTDITPTYLNSGASVAPIVKITNNGYSTESVYSVTLSDGGTYTQTVDVTTSIASKGTYDVTFPSWSPADGIYTLTATVALIGDLDASNDVMSTGCSVMNTRVAFASVYNSGNTINGVLTVPLNAFSAWGNSLQIQGMAWKDDILYGVAYNGEFGTVSIKDGSFTSIGGTGVACSFRTSLLCDPTTGILYMTTLSGSYPSFTVGLYSVDPATGAATLVANSSHTGTAAIFAFDDSGNLFALEHIPTAEGMMYSVNKTTAEMTLIGGVGGIISSNFQPMAYDFHNHVMYYQASAGSDGNMNGCYRLNLATGAATHVGVTYTGQVLAMVIPDLDAKLSNLTVDGNAVKDFSPSKFTCSYLLPSETTVAPTVVPTTFYATSTTSITDAAALPGATTVAVTALDGTSNMYTLNLNVAAITDALLTDLAVNGTTVAGFDPATYSYTVELPYGTTVAPPVTAILEDANATKVITNAAALPGATTVVVTAHDGTTQLTYTVNFTIALPSTDASIFDLTVDGKTVSGFDPAVYSYTVELPYGTTVVPTVDAAVNDATATKVVTDAIALPGTTTLVVTAQDGITKETYTINFTLALPSTNALLSDLAVDGNTVNGFDPINTTYNVLLPSGTTTVPTVTAVNDATATQVITNAAALPGATTVVVTAQDGVTTLTYTINFTVAEVTDAKLTDLMVDGNSVDGFGPATYSYTVELPYGTTIVPSVTAILEDANATKVVTDAAALPGATTVVVTAADGTTQLTYTVNFTITAPSTDATLSDLTVDGNSVDGFGPATYSYTVELPYGTTVIPTVDATVVDGNASMVITDAAALPGATIVVVTAQDGTTKLTYTVNFTITAPSTDATLSDLTVDGNSVDGFGPATYSYTVELPYGTTVIPTVTATANDAAATKVITDAAALPGATTVVVTAQDGTTKLTYTVNFTITAPSTDATLSDLTVDGNSVDGFGPATYSYTVELPYGTTVIPTVTATVNDAAATKVITDAAALPGATTVVVTAQDGTTKLTYTVNFTITAPSTDATLSDLTVDGNSVDGFGPATYSYTVELPYGTTVIPTVTATANDAAATKVITDAAALPGATTVVVTAQDGTTKLTYTVNFTITAPSTDATLSDLKVDGTTVTDFNAATYTYNVVLPFGMIAVPTVTATTKDAAATKVITDAPALPGATTVVVTAQDGTTKLTYTINFTVAPETAFVVFNVVGANGTLAATVDASAVTSPATVVVGKNVEFTATPDAGYQVKEWKLDNNVVAGNTTNTYTLSNVTVNSIVTVEFKLITGISDLDESSLSVYPIPATDHVNVKMNAAISRIVVVNITGQVVLESAFNSTEGTLNTSNLASGVYFLRVESANGVTVKQIQIAK